MPPASLPDDKIRAVREWILAGALQTEARRTSKKRLRSFVVRVSKHQVTKISLSRWKAQSTDPLLNAS